MTAWYGTSDDAKDQLVHQIREACKGSGFFTLISHGIPASLQKDILACSEEFFSLPLDTKDLYDKGAQSQKGESNSVLTYVQTLKASVEATSDYELRISKSVRLGI